YRALSRVPPPAGFRAPRSTAPSNFFSSASILMIVGLLTEGMLRRLPTRNDRLQHDVCKAHTGVRKTVSKNVPRRGPILVQTQPTPTSYVRRSRPEIVDLRPDLESLFTLANRRLQPLGHLTATRKLSIRHASNLHSIGLSPR